VPTTFCAARLACQKVLSPSFSEDDIANFITRLAEHHRDWVGVA
jgi:hypothetical protein